MLTKKRTRVNFRPQKRRNKRKAQLGLFLLLLLGVFLLFSLLKTAKSETVSQNQEAVAASETKPDLDQEIKPAPVAKEPSVQDIHEAIAGVVSSHPEATIGVSYIDLNSGESTNVNGSSVFTAASTAKPIPAVMFLRGVESGKYTMAKNLGGYAASWQLKQMINQSNNNSWAAFNNLLGFTNEQNFAKSIGMNYSAYQNTMSANDLATLLSKLYKGELLNQANTQLLLSYMTKTNEERLMPAAYPNATVYHKYGWIYGFVHDGAIVLDGDDKYVLVVYTNNTKNSDLAARACIFKEIAAAIRNQ